MMKKLLNLKSAMLSACIVACCCTANAQDFIWASHQYGVVAGGVNLQVYGGSPNTVGNSIAIDKYGNTFLVGYYDADTLNISTTASSANTAQNPKFPAVSGYVNGYLVKYDTTGKIVWIKHLGDGYTNITDVAIDITGNVYITGMFNRVTDFNGGGTGGVVTPVGSYDGYIAKYDNDGNFIWVKSFGSPMDERGYHIGLDTLGNVYINGTFTNTTLDFSANITIYRVNGIYAGFNNFIAKYDTSGTCKWALGVGYDWPVGDGHFVVSPSGEVYFAGSISGGPIILGTGQNTISLTGRFTWFLAKYSADGVFEWGYDIAGANARNMAVDNNGDLILIGSFSGTTASPFDLNFGSGTDLFTPVGGSSSDMYVAKYKPDGTYVWAKNMGGPSSELGRSVAVDKANNIYLLGQFSGTGNFNLSGNGSDTLRSVSSTDLAVVKYTSDGAFLWAKQVAGSGAVNAGGIAVSNRGRVSITGAFAANTTLDVDPGPDSVIFTNPTGSGIDAFVINLTCNDTTAAFLTETLECGAPYTLNDEIYTAAGTYIQHRPNTAGCDSVITFELVYSELNPEITIDVDTLSTIESYSSYQWIKDGDLIAGATNAKLTVSENGDYQVIVTNQYGCTDTSKVYPVTNQQVSVKDINGIGQQIKVFPNPAKETIYIKSPVNINIELTGIDGRTLTSKENATSLSVKGWPNGIYFLKINDKEGRLIRVEKIVKE